MISRRFPRAAAPPSREPSTAWRTPISKSTSTRTTRCLGRPQAFLEGRTYLGSANVTTDANGKATINVVLPVAIAAGDTRHRHRDRPRRQHVRALAAASSFRRAPAPGPRPASRSRSRVSASSPARRSRSAASPRPTSSSPTTTQITATTPSLPPGSLNDIIVTNTDGSAGTLPNGWIADFLDVPGNNQFHTYVTTLVRNAITAGVGNGNYGVAQDTKRQQMAVFLLKAKNGICYTPPPCTVQVFPDVPCSVELRAVDQRARRRGHHQRLRRRDLLSGPAPSTAQQMAVFLLKAVDGSGYAPPACTAATFTDVPCGSNFAPWIYELVGARTSPPAAAGATTARSPAPPADRWRCSSSRPSRSNSEDRVKRLLAVLCSIGVSAAAPAATFTVTNTNDSERRVAPSGDHGRQRHRGRRHHRVRHRGRRRPHDRPRLGAAVRHRRRHDRRLHAAGLVAEHAVRSPRAPTPF